MGQDRGEMGQDWAKIGPRRGQDGPTKMGQDGPNIGPRWANGALGSPALAGGVAA